MPEQETETFTYFPPDLTVQGADGTIVLAVKVRTRLIHKEAEVLEQLASYLQFMKEKHNKNIPYAMFVDRQKINIYSWSEGPLSAPLLTLETSVVLGEYDPEYKQTDQQISEYYAETLIEAWLKDLIDEWQSENPPYKVELKEQGILKRLKQSVGSVIL
ncbi:hypothetical protein [Candidatus Cyanaurora vandensis]|uniref:hypothetical protein n=1 Tax=Candidatus Cyanaurora vandensis TaxID=2714958 RepID=UPI00257BF618|nr:hypothetical protein [Candidatus Cyanaurora vandensis]